MRLAIANHGLFPFLLGGMERHTLGLATYMARLGVEVEVIIPCLSAEQQARLPAYPFRLTQLPWPKSWPWLYANYRFSCAVRDHLRTDPPDVFYAQGFNGWAYLSDPLARTSINFYNPHGLEMFKTVGALQTLKHWPMRWAARIQAQKAKAVVSLGGKLTDEVIRFLKVAAHKIVELPNALDLEYVEPLLVAPTATTNRQRSVIFVGRLEHNKGIDLLCKSVMEVDNLRLDVVGEGALKEQLQRQYSSQRIRFLGKLDDAELFKRYAAAWAFVFASRYEGMPTVILEAMAAGLPIVATDIGAVKTMVDATNGWVVPPGDARALTEALRQVIALDSQDRASMGKIAQQRLRQRFTWDVVAKQTWQTMSHFSTHVAG